MMRAVAPIIGGLYLPRHDPHHGQAVGVIFDPVGLFKHALRTDSLISYSKTHNP
jgi:hypothetical protein